MRRRPLIAGNWKMHGNKAQVASLLLALKQGCERVETAELAVLVPAIFLQQTQECLIKTQIAWGAQDVSEEASGAFTGEISAGMLADFQCRYVIVGHSERRQRHAEGDQRVAGKCYAALSQGIIPILCVGETEAEYQAGKTVAVVKKQLAAVLDLADNPQTLNDLVIAYEPVWAIGTGRQATPEQAQQVHAVLRNQLRALHPLLADSVRILYGGSVKPDNAAAIFAMPDVDGGLIGGASLHSEQFLEIGKLCNNSF